jgi:nitroreductase
MQRRSLLRGLGLIAAGPLLDGCAGLTRYPVMPDDRHADGIWREGLAHARWAPSPHNIQPWRVHIQSPVRAELLCDPDSLLRTTDADSAFTLIGFAIFVEYLAVALRPCGYALRAEFDLQPLDYSTRQPQRVARLSLEPAAFESDMDRQLIKARRTSRLPYDGKRVAEADLQALSKLAADHGQQLGWSSEDDFVHWVLELNRDALFADIDAPVSRTELRPWLRFTDEEARATQTGLSATCLGFPGWLLRSLFDQHQKWVQGWRRRIGGDLLVKSMHGTRTIAWWSGPFATPADWISCGTLLARAWLEATRRGLSLHPFGSVITNPPAHAMFREQVHAEERPGHIWMLVRLGYSVPPPRSYRLDGERLLVADINAGVAA